jgi:hypothetical protein
VSTRRQRDPLDAVARVACAERERLLRVYRRRLPREDLEDCLGQATLELLLRAKRDGGFVSEAHIANALDQRLGSRVCDRLRARAGTSPLEVALRTANPTGEDDPIERLADARADVHELVCARERLRRVSVRASLLSADQRLVLASQIDGEVGCAGFCERHRWSAEKYRKVAQRARARLREAAW